MSTKMHAARIGAATLAAAVVALTAACSSAPPATPAHSPVAASTSTNAAPLPPVTPQRIAIAAKPNGLAVRATDGALFVTDENTNSVLQSADGTRFTSYATLPPVPGQPTSLSQIAFDDAGTLLIERFGFGTASAVFVAAPPTATTGGDALIQLTGIDPTRRRLGLASLGRGKLLSTWFVKNGNEPEHGGLSLITYDPVTGTANERDLVVDLVKPVGVAVAGDNVYVSDQAQNTIQRASLATLLSMAQPAVSGAAFAHVDAPDLLAAAPDGRLFTKCGATGVCAIAADGTTSVLANDFQQARGIAVDAPRNRLVVVDRASGTSGVSALRILPLR
ncbi:hypothetical protein [Paraburkholderia phosphatilytica]|uniref:hypothetical protein n=1 Tax=Paraburkholderia phosphatilytica TaxID=2282883 RepID=UPI001F0CDA32|nr:hypothetical protein [Paraburkholderia phosphatilytica]